MISIPSFLVCQVSNLPGNTLARFPFAVVIKFCTPRDWIQQCLDIFSHLNIKDNSTFVIVDVEFCTALLLVQEVYHLSDLVRCWHVESFVVDPCLVEFLGVLENILSEVLLKEGIDC